MSLVVITSCTNGKRLPPAAGLRASELPAINVAGAAREWANRIKHAEALGPAGELYKGGAFSVAKKTAKNLSAPLFILSAGLGLIADDDAVPSYALTVSAGSCDDIGHHCSGHCTPSDWWQHLNEALGTPNPVASLVQRYSSCRILLAVPLNYGLMISNDLGTLDDDDLVRVRLFGGYDVRHLPQRIKSIAMPYDQRFDGENTPVAGTKGNFAQRALQHFASLPLSSDPTDIDADRKLVLQALAPLSKPRTVVRRSLPDQAVKNLIRENWLHANGQSTKMLRLFRDVLRVACEQKRFSMLFNEIKQEKIS